MEINLDEWGILIMNDGEVVKFIQNLEVKHENNKQKRIE